MLNFINDLFDFFERVIIWIKKPSMVSTISQGYFSLLCLTILYGLMIKYIDIKIINVIFGFIMGLLIPLIIFLGSLTQYKIYLQPFTHKAFLYGMLPFSLLSTAILYVMIFKKITYFFEAFCVISAMFTIAWFSYHIVNQTVPFRKIKLTLKLYLAVGSTLSFLLLIIPIFQSENIFKIMITSLLSGFAWITYIIEEKEARQ